MKMVTADSTRFVHHHTHSPLEFQFSTTLFILLLQSLSRIFQAFPKLQVVRTLHGETFNTEVSIEVLPTSLTSFLFIHDTTKVKETESLWLL